MNSENFHT
uniref:Uncharacterized protein n=1 Tax=Anguilla anguilla TaxID=7936 RepID=A0A0E9VX53_ANGAN